MTKESYNFHISVWYSIIIQQNKDFSLILLIFNLKANKLNK